MIQDRLGASGSEPGLIAEDPISDVIAAVSLLKLATVGARIILRVVSRRAAQRAALKAALQSKTGQLTAEEVTASVAKNAMAEAPLLSQQESIWLPKVREYVKLLQQGVQNIDPIRVGSGIIVEGHHRYVAARILGIVIPIQEWTSGRFSIPWNLVKFVE